MTVMAKILFGQIGTQENQIIGEEEKIVSEAMTVVRLNTNGMMTSAVRNIQSYVKSQVYQLINMITRDGKQGQYKNFHHVPIYLYSITSTYYVNVYFPLIFSATATPTTTPAATPTTTSV